MLTALDESLLHQLPLPFSQAGTSDHRFFDRVIIGCFHPEGELAFVAGMGVYKNMNVIDGFVFAQVGSEKQHNIRFSKALHPIQHPNGSQIGPLRIDPLRPLESFRLVMERGEFDIAVDIEFTNVLPARLENPHIARLDGRLSNDYLRFHQLGQATGWAEVAGKRFDIEQWFSWRDHSWGTRPNVGGFEPFTGTKTGSGLPSASRSGSASTMVCHVGFWNGRQGGGVQFIENGEGRRLYTDGVVGIAGENEETAVAKLDHDIRFYPGTRIVDKMELDITLVTGERWEVQLDTLARPFVYRGGGYNSGYLDAKGHGVFRSHDLLIERDLYDVSDIELVGFENGTAERPVHREQFAKAVVNGIPGFAYTPCIVIGDHPRYDIGNSTT